MTSFPSFSELGVCRFVCKYFLTKIILKININNSRDLKTSGAQSELNCPRLTASDGSDTISEFFRIGCLSLCVLIFFDKNYSDDSY